MPRKKLSHRLKWMSLEVLILTRLAVLALQQYPWLEQISRQEQLMIGCDNLNLRSKKKVSDLHLDHILVDHSHRLLYCYVPKVACTNWKRVLMVLTGESTVPNLIEIPSSLAHSENSTLKLSKLSPNEAEKCLRDYTLFLVTRHPFERLLSAYRNKFLDSLPSSKYFQNRYGRYIIQKYRQNPSKSDLESGANVTFSEFIRYLIHEGVNSNEHWTPIYNLCLPCFLNYTFIGQYETITEDAKTLLNMVGAPHLYFPVTRGGHTKDKLSGDWQGLDGMVIQKNPDENVNHIPSASLSIPEDNANASGDTATKRNVTTTRRSLPDIPADQNSSSNWEPIVDNSSEHYATLEQYSVETKRNNVSNGIVINSTSQYSSTSETEKPYERVKYDKMSSKEHPYAQLQPVRSGVHEDNHSTPEERMTLLRTEGAIVSDPVACSRSSRRSSIRSTEEHDIPAASAVAGAVAASPELPYMTPPVNQMNFSGDSQDSSKGYTSISVREPLADIIAQTKKADIVKRKLDPHYSTLSDDSSDDVYTTIADPKNAIYTSESETYARIEPLQITVEAEINHSSQTEEAETLDRLYEPPPDTPVENSKQNSGPTYTHSRQASSSSSTANLGSPKPEKRQANSPLPPPPIVNSFDFHSDRKSIKNLDDMYAKVHKIKKEDSPEENVDNSFSRIPNRISLPDPPDPNDSLNDVEEHNYETLKSRQTSDPGYERITGAEEPGYASINGSESITSSDPGYEVLKNKSLSDVDPNYEELRHKVSNASDFSGYSKIRDLLDGYSVVNKSGRKSTNVSVTSDCGDEPNYESMPSEVKDAILQSHDNEVESNYESVAQMPNYESISDIEQSSKNLSAAKSEKVDESRDNKQLNNSFIVSTDSEVCVVDENGVVQI